MLPEILGDLLNSHVNTVRIMLCGLRLPEVTQENSVCRELDLSECRGVSGSALQAVLTGALPALECVMLTGIPEVSNSLLAEMGLGLPLRHISIGLCTAVGDEGLRGLAAACPQLLTLRADQCVKITDDGMVALAESCKELQVGVVAWEKLM